MTKGKAFFVVGHKNWGKSETLKELTDGNWRFHWFEINEEWFFFQRMSNDDIPDEFHERLDKLDPEDKPLVIIALCPTFDDEEQRNGLIKHSKNSAKGMTFSFSCSVTHIKAENTGKSVQQKLHTWKSWVQ